MLAMQVNHSSLPSLLASLRRFLLALILGTFRFSFSVSILLDLALSSSLSPPSPRASLSFSSLSPSSRWKERRRRTYVASHTTQLFRLPPEQRHYTIVSFSPFLVVPYRNQILRFPTRATRHKKAKRATEAEFRAKEREDGSKAANKFSRIILSARADRMRLETRLPVKRRAPQA